MDLFLSLFFSHAHIQCITHFLESSTAAMFRISTQVGYSYVWFLHVAHDTYWQWARVSVNLHVEVQTCQMKAADGPGPFIPYLDTEVVNDALQYITPYLQVGLLLYVGTESWKGIGYQAYAFYRHSPSRRMNGLPSFPSMGGTVCLVNDHCTQEADGWYLDKLRRSIN